MYDRMSPSEMVDHHQFRLKRLSHLFFCSDCTRSFDSEEEISNCRFCNSTAIRKLSTNTPKKMVKKQFLRYYCPACEKNFISEKMVEACQMCGGGRLHFYKWEKLWFRDMLRARVTKIVNNIKKFVFRTHKIYETNKLQEPANWKIEHMTEEARKIKKSRPKPVVIRKVYTIRLPRFSFSMRSSRSKEEMPSR